MDDSSTPGQGATNPRRTEDAAPHTVAAVRSTLAARRAEVACAALLLLMGVNLFTAISRKTLTNDEVVHIPAGYYDLVAGRFQFNNEHPPLVKMWAALPILLLRPEVPPAPRTPEEFAGEEIAGYHARFWAANAALFPRIIFWTRVWMLPVTLSLGALIFAYARKLFGARAAVFAVALFAFEPTVLAHGRIVHTDVPAALAYLAFFYALHLYLEAPTLRRAAWLGVVAAAALLIKFSMLVTLPVLVAAALFMFWRAGRLGLRRARAAQHAGLVLLIILLAVNAGYYFQRTTLTEPDARLVATTSGDHGGQLASAFAAGSRVLPTYFMFGAYQVELHNRLGHPTSLLGMQSDLGWWYYFPVAFALKTSLPFLLVSLAALSWSLWRLLAKRDKRFLALVVPFAVYAALSMTSHINIGIRHFLPAFPFLFIAGGALLDRLLASARGRWQSGVALLTVAVALGWGALEAARAYPDYIPYMNQLASSHPHWYYLSDSNVEWGDDVNALADYLRARGERRVRAALAGGWATLRFYDVEYVNLLVPPGTPLPETRYVAIGAGSLNGSTVLGLGALSAGEKRADFFARYRARQPEAIFGGSIYLYRER